MRVLITGGRSFGVVVNPKSAADRERAAKERQMAHAALSHIPLTATLVHGDASGADRLCAEIWKSFELETEAHPAKWELCEGPNCRPEHRKVNKWGKEYCPTAGHFRNQKMVNSGVEFLLAFPGGTGTRDCIERALKAGVKVIDATTGERIEK